MTADPLQEYAPLAPQPMGIPVPTPSRRSAPYWEALRQGVLTFQRCTNCATIPPKAAPVCPHCASPELVWTPSAGTGTLYSWTVVWRPQHPTFQVPYVPCIVELDEGWYLMSSLIGCRTDEIEPGMRVQVECHPASEQITLAYVSPLR